MFRLKNEKTLRIFSSILKSYKREKHLQPFRLLNKFIKIRKKKMAIVTMKSYKVRAIIKRLHTIAARRPPVEEREA